MNSIENFLTSTRAIGTAVFVALLCLPGTSARAQSATAAHIEKAVDLTTQGCAQVKEGDVIAFDWNPGFDHAGGVAGMQKVFLIFARRGEEEQTQQGQGGIRLVAMAPVERAGPHDSSIAALPNGFYRALFRTSLRGVAPGEYYLIDARGDARITARHQGPAPVMTNSPLRSFYCLNVVKAPDVEAATR